LDDFAPRSGSWKGIMVESIGGEYLERCHIPRVHAFEEVADQAFVLFD
jgi:hypothetical protein